MSQPSRSRIARITNFIRAAETMAQVMEVNAREAVRLVNKSCDELCIARIPTDDIERLTHQLGEAFKTYHARLNAAAEDNDVPIPLDDDEDVIIPLGGGGSKGG